MTRGGGGAGVRARGAAARPHLRAVGDPGRAERQPALGAGGRRVRDLRRGRAVLHRGVLLPHLSELGQPRLFPARRSVAERGGGAGCVSRPILSRAPCPAPRAAEPRGRRARRRLPRSSQRARRPPHRDRRAEARREEGTRRQRPAQRARGAVAQARGGGEPGEAAGARSASLRASSTRRGAWRSTTTRTSWARTRSAR